MFITVDLDEKSPCRTCPHLLRKFSDGQPSRRSDSEHLEKQPSQPSGRRGRPGILSQAAVEWLREYLKGGPKPIGNRNGPSIPGTLFGDAFLHGLKCGTVWDAASKIGVRKERIDKRWYWSLPTENNLTNVQVDADCQSLTVASRSKQTL